MKILKQILWAMVLICLLSSFVSAGDFVTRTTKSGKYTVYNKRDKCQMVCTADRPFLETVESGLAYALDIPLAILSPLTCPIVSPVMSRIDPVEERSYRRSRK